MHLLQDAPSKLRSPKLLPSRRGRARLGLRFARADGTHRRAARTDSCRSHARNSTPTSALPLAHGLHCGEGPPPVPGPVGPRWADVRL